MQGKDRVDRAILMQAAHEVFPSRMASRRSRLIAVVTGLVLMAGSALVAALYQQGHEVAAEQAATSAKPTASGAITQASAQAKAMTALPATLAWPANLPRSSDRSLAYAALFKAWGAEYHAGADICRQAAGMGLICRIGRGGLDELRYLNRPAILYLHDRQGQPFNATLTRLDANAATFVIGNEAIAVSLGALAQQWSGYYKLLWRSFPYANRSILAGDRGPAVAWLNRQLALAQGGVTATAQAPVFDDELMSQVKRFQLAQGLLPDGIAGPRTLTLLSAVADQAAPKLFHSNGDK
ncbi:MAG: peptidoglycan-binding protein [Gallionellaceae bacterium]|nr:peptidoglycan-binding protein [Gallionellaceae bacterium]